ncbi:hypothetical protein D3C85_1703870 [compost metagenome]
MTGVPGCDHRDERAGDNDQNQQHPFARENIKIIHNANRSRNEDKRQIALDEIRSGIDPFGREKLT